MRLPIYRQTSNISRTLTGKVILITPMYLEQRLSVLLQLHLHYLLNTWLQWIGQRRLQDEIRKCKFWNVVQSYIRDFTVLTVYPIKCWWFWWLYFLVGLCVSLPIFLWVALLALGQSHGQSHDCPSASEAILKTWVKTTKRHIGIKTLYKLFV